MEKMDLESSGKNPMSQAGMHKEHKLTSVFVLIVYPSVNLKVFGVFHCSITPNAYKKCPNSHHLLDRDTGWILSVEINS